MQLERLSYSQLNSFRQCPRAWWLNKVQKRQVTPSVAQQLGTAIHKTLEEYITSGRLEGEPEVVRRAGPALNFIPSAGTPGVVAEMPVELVLGPLPFFGVVDLWQVDDEGVVSITDYKTTSDIKWCDTPEKLAVDWQLLAYAKMAYDRGASRVYIRKLYLTTRGTPRAVPVSVETSRAAVDRAVEEMTALANVMIQVAKCETAEEVEKHLDHCAAFGGCQFRLLCHSASATLETLFKANSENTHMTPLSNRELDTLRTLLTDAPLADAKAVTACLGELRAVNPAAADGWEAHARKLAANQVVPAINPPEAPVPALEFQATVEAAQSRDTRKAELAAMSLAVLRGMAGPAHTKATKAFCIQTILDAEATKTTQGPEDAPAQASTPVEPPEAPTASTSPLIQVLLVDALVAVGTPAVDATIAFAREEQDVAISLDVAHYSLVQYRKGCQLLAATVAQAPSFPARIALSSAHPAFPELYGVLAQRSLNVVRGVR